MKPGDLISGKYRLLRALGSGGMGSVWAARNELTDRDFAIKFLLPKLAKNQEAIERFFLEARACGQIKHPAVVDVYDMGQAEDQSPYLVMELLDGEGLDQRLSRKGKVDAMEAAAWVAFIARGLEEAHKRNLIHRDLKPGNVFFALDDRGDVIPKILDFGVSKATGPAANEHHITHSGAVLGSPAYMSPEQARGELDIDGRSDVWSLGIILYEAIAGKPPFDASNYNALMVAILMKPHVSLREVVPTVAPLLSELVDEALEKDPRKRVGSAAELAERLELIVGELAPELLPAQPRVRSVPPPPNDTTGSATTGPWSDSRRLGPLPGARAIPSVPPPAPPSEDSRTRRRSRTSPVLWMGLGVAIALTAGVGATAAARAQTPLVAVARRGALAMSAGLARLDTELGRLAKEAEPKAPEPASTTAATSSPTDGAKDPKKPKSPRSPKDDPHGGVDGPGF